MMRNSAWPMLLSAVISITAPLLCIANPKAPVEPTPSVSTQATNSEGAKDSSATVSPPPVAPLDFERRDFAFRLQRVSGRLGPDYSVTVLGDRSITLVATLNSKLESCCDIVKHTTMSRKDYDALVKQVETMKFFDLPEFYGYVSFHSSRVTTSVLGPYGGHSVERSNIPCESKFHELGLGVATEPSPTATMTSRVKRAVDTEPNPLEGKTPPPDSVCMLELMIDHMSGADRLGQDFRAVRDVY